MDSTIAISGVRNVIKKEAEKIIKHKYLTIEIQHMWNAETTVIPIITGATGTISESSREYVSCISGKHEVSELQKTAILGSAHTLQKVLTSKCKTFNMGNNVTCTINCNWRRAATLFPSNMVYFRYTSLNNLHKVDK
jgi:hypothetical protein